MAQESTHGQGHAAEVLLSMLYVVYLSTDLPQGCDGVQRNITYHPAHLGSACVAPHSSPLPYYHPDHAFWSYHVPYHGVCRGPGHLPSLRLAPDACDGCPPPLYASLTSRCASTPSLCGPPPSVSAPQPAPQLQTHKPPTSSHAVRLYTGYRYEGCERLPFSPLKFHWLQMRALVRSICQKYVDHEIRVESLQTANPVTYFSREV